MVGDAINGEFSEKNPAVPGSKLGLFLRKSVPMVSVLGFIGSSKSADSTSSTIGTFINRNFPNNELL